MSTEIATPSTDYSDLIARLGKASGPDYGLSQDVGRALDQPQRYEHPGSKNSSWPNYTASIDAALTLMPEGAHWKVGRDKDGTVERGPLSYASVGGARIYEAATPALALLIAILRAREAQGK